jgi:hypothetical protein
LPGLLSQQFDGVENGGLKDLIPPWGDREQHIVDLCVGTLEFLEGLQLRIVLGEEDAIVVVEGQVGGTGAGEGGNGEGAENDKPTPADIPLRNRSVNNKSETTTGWARASPLTPRVL